MLLAKGLEVIPAQCAGEIDLHANTLEECLAAPARMCAAGVAAGAHFNLGSVPLARRVMMAGPSTV